MDCPVRLWLLPRIHQHKCLVMFHITFSYVVNVYHGRGQRVRSRCVDMVIVYPTSKSDYDRFIETALDFFFYSTHVNSV